MLQYFLYKYCTTVEYSVQYYSTQYLLYDKYYLYLYLPVQYITKYGMRNNPDTQLQHAAATGTRTCTCTSKNYVERMTSAETLCRHIIFFRRQPGNSGNIHRCNRHRLLNGEAATTLRHYYDQKITSVLLLFLLVVSN